MYNKRLFDCMNHGTAADTVPLALLPLGMAIAPARRRPLALPLPGFLIGISTLYSLHSVSDSVLLRRRRLDF